MGPRSRVVVRKRQYTVADQQPDDYGRSPDVAVWCPEERPRGLVEHTVPGRINLPGGPDTRVDIVESFDRVIRTPACCRMTGRGRHGGITDRCG